MNNKSVMLNQKH